MAKSKIDFEVKDARAFFKTAWNRSVDVRRLIQLDLLEPEKFLSYWEGKLGRFDVEESIKGVVRLHYKPVSSVSSQNS